MNIVRQQAGSTQRCSSQHDVRTAPKLGRRPAPLLPVAIASEVNSAFVQRLQAEEREVNDRLLSYRKQGFHCSADVLADRLNGLRRRIDQAQRALLASLSK